MDTERAKGEPPGTRDWSSAPLYPERTETAGRRPENLFYGVVDYHDDEIPPDLRTAVEGYLDDAGSDAPREFQVDAHRPVELETGDLETHLLEVIEETLADEYGDIHSSDRHFAPTKKVRDGVGELMETVRSEYASPRLKHAPEWSVVVRVGDGFYERVRRNEKAFAENARNTPAAGSGEDEPGPTP